jgi:hypothetical protein
MNTGAQTETRFKFIDAQLRVNGIRPHPQIQLAHNTILSKGGKEKFNIPRVELKSFSFSSSSQSLSIDNSVLG